MWYFIRIMSWIIFSILFFITKTQETEKYIQYYLHLTPVSFWRGAVATKSIGSFTSTLRTYSAIIQFGFREIVFRSRDVRQPEASAPNISSFFPLGFIQSSQL